MKKTGKKKTTAKKPALARFKRGSAHALRAKRGNPVFKRGLILAGDIGGTKTLLGLFEVIGTILRPVKKTRFLNADFGGVEPLAALFLKKTGARGITKAAFAVACPVEDNRGILTNAGWEVDGESIKKTLGLKELTLVNDLAATGHAIPHLRKKDLAVLQKGVRKKGNAAIIAAGTGLGEAILFWDGKRHRPSATEGGHADFAPRDPLEARLLSHLTNVYGHVSFERVVSGRGLCNIYDFLKAERDTPEPEYLREKFSIKDPAAVISEEAVGGTDPDCADALDIFISIYGAEAGNLALKSMAVAGVYVAGGIAPKILPALKGGVFASAFRKKGRFEKLLGEVPIDVILNQEAALLGAAAFAAGIGVKPALARLKRGAAK